MKISPTSGSETKNVRKTCRNPGSCFRSNTRRITRKQRSTCSTPGGRISSAKKVSTAFTAQLAETIVQSSRFQLSCQYVDQERPKIFSAPSNVKKIRHHMLTCSNTSPHHIGSGVVLHSIAPMFNTINSVTSASNESCVTMSNTKPRIPARRLALMLVGRI